MVLVADKVWEARKNKAEYDAKLKEFSWIMKDSRMGRGNFSLSEIKPS